MTIWKKRALKPARGGPVAFALASACAWACGAAPARALVPDVENRFECLKTLLPLTRGKPGGPRPGGVEPPFLINENYLVFPRAEDGRVAGFFVYDHDHAWYYDAVEAGGAAPPTPLKNLRAGPGSGVIELTAQPNGLETIAIPHLPGFLPRALAVEPTYQNTAILGASVLPVVGAFIPRPKGRGLAYHDPRQAEGGGKARTILRLAAGAGQSSAARWAPLEGEIERRRGWVQQNNIDLVTFRGLVRAMRTGCRPRSN